MTFCLLSACKTTELTGVIRTIGAEPQPQLVLEEKNGQLYYLKAHEMVRTRLQNEYGYQQVKIRGRIKKGTRNGQAVSILELKCKTLTK